MPAPIPTPVQSRPGPEESDCVVVGAATMIEGILAVSISVLVPDCPVDECSADEDDADVKPDELDDDKLDNDELDRLEEANDNPDVD